MPKNQATTAKIPWELCEWVNLTQECGVRVHSWISGIISIESTTPSTYTRSNDSTVWVFKSVRTREKWRQPLLKSGPWTWPELYISQFDGFLCFPRVSDIMEAGALPTSSGVYGQSWSILVEFTHVVAPACEWLCEVIANRTIIKQKLTVVLPWNPISGAEVVELCQYCGRGKLRTSRYQGCTTETLLNSNESASPQKWWLSGSQNRIPLSRSRSPRKVSHSVDRVLVH